VYFPGIFRRARVHSFEQTPFDNSNHQNDWIAGDCAIFSDFSSLITWRPRVRTQNRVERLQSVKMSALEVGKAFHAVTAARQQSDSAGITWKPLKSARRSRLDTLRAR